VQSHRIRPVSRAGFDRTRGYAGNARAAPVRPAAENNVRRTKSTPEESKEVLALHSQQSNCPRCGGGPLPEFTDPAGVAVCPQCGTMLRRTSTDLAPIGQASGSLRRLLEKSTRKSVLDDDQVREYLVKFVAERRGVTVAEVLANQEWLDFDHWDSLDVVEMVMAVEEEFDVELEL